MTVLAPERLPGAPVARPEASTAGRAPRRHWAWLAAGAVLAFLVPFLFADLLAVSRDLYYGIYVAAVFGFFWLWLRSTSDSPRAVLTRNWRWGVALGLVFVALMAAVVWREPATGHPHGVGFAAAVLWRGVVYGFADGLLLSAFPILAVFAAFAGRRILARRSGKAAVGALALAVSLLFTAVYHLGYPDFRGEKLRKPLAGDVMWSVPTLATLSPVASPITHAGLHVSAVVHAYEGDTFLPPHASALDRAALQGILDEAQGIAPGATAYVSGPAGTWSGAAGVADLRTGRPMRPDARMRLESVSKAWTATILLQLVGERKLRLADTVERWLPGLLPDGDRITIRMLLNHTSGLIDNNDIRRDATGYLRQVDDPALRAELLRVGRAWDRNPSLEFPPRLWVRFAAALPLVAEPGASFHYSNIGYDVAGLVAERAGGKPLAALYRRQILEPLGLESAAYDPQGPIAGPHARGYQLGGQRPLDRTDAHGGVGAEGGVVSDAEDEARFLTALMRGELLRPRELRAMKTPSDSAFYGLGLSVQPSGCAGTVYGHSGGGDAYKSNVWVSEAGDQVAVLLLNGRTPTRDDLAETAMERLFCAAGRAR